MRRNRGFAALAIILVLVLFAGAFAVSADDENLLVNPGFEESASGLPSGWNAGAWYTDEEATEYSLSENAHSGASCIRIRNVWMNDARYFQTVPVEPNSVYRFSAYVLAEDISEGWGANLSVENCFAHTEGVYDTAGEWLLETLYFETADGQNEVTLYLRVGGYSGESKGTASFDDARLEKIDASAVPAGATVQSVAQAMQDPSQSQSASSDDSGVKFLWPMIALCAVSLFLFFTFRSYFVQENTVGDDGEVWRSARMGLVFGLIFAGALRLILAPLVYGYPNDMACWMYWGDTMLTSGPWKFYETTSFCDYPPLYLYVLWLFGALRALFGIELGSTLNMALMKIPPILADLGTCILLFRLAKKKGSAPGFALAVSLLYAFMPAVWFNSSCFGQIDSVLALVMIVYLYWLYDNKILYSSVLLVLGTLMKPQMLLAAPALLVVFVKFWQQEGWKKALLIFVKSLAAGLGAGFLAILPFWGRQEGPWIVRLYLSTLGSYPYGSISACNFMTLIGGLWKPDTNRFLGLTLKLWGYLGIGASVVLYFVTSFKNKDRDSLFLHVSLLLTGIYTLGCYMHERYLFPVLAILLIGYVLTRRKNLLVYFLFFATTLFANTSLVLANEYLPDGHWSSMLVSLLNVVGFAVMAVDAVRQAWGRKELPLWPHFAVKSEEDRRQAVLSYAARKVNEKDPPRESLPEKKDVLPLILVTVAYAVLAFIYLGSNSTPKTYWETSVPEETVTVDLGDEHTEVRELWTYRGLCYNSAVIDVEGSTDGSSWSYIRELYMMDHNRGGDVFRWFSDELAVPSDMRYVRFTVKMPIYRLHEIFFRDGDGNVIPIQNVIGAAEREYGPFCAFDEQDLYYESESFYNATYFDEIYHARTAWELIHHESVYEITHPPLGKILIGVGIRIFGLTPFGWRFTGTLIGVLMLPVMFLLGKALFRDSRYAWIATFLLSFDFMHFVQTRISTIDSYSVFFTMLMMYFMLRFMQRNYHRTPIRKLLLDLGLSGLFFGFGAASKWTCLYSGAGLAVMFFFHLAMKTREAVLMSRRQVEGVSEEDQERLSGNFAKRTAVILAWCVLVFVLIPAVIYCLSYLPYMKNGFDFKVILDNQKYMLNYHSTLVDDHFFKSPWYQWPLLIKPMWYYQAKYLESGWIGCISSFGNPAVWWAGTVAMIWLIVRCFREGFRAEKSWWILAGYGSQYLPWVLVPRSMFIYHYFGSVPFFILAITLFIRSRMEADPARTKKILLVYAIIVVVLFVAFYPVLSGLPIPRVYAKCLRWMPTWWFFN